MTASSTTEGFGLAETTVLVGPAPGQTAGGFAETVENVAAVGSRMTDHIVGAWDTWQAGVPALAPAK